MEGWLWLHRIYLKHFSYYLSKPKIEQRQHIQNGMELLIRLAKLSKKP